jgi:hypothetical protein
MSAIGMRKGLPKRTFYNQSKVYFVESGKKAPPLSGCNLGCCLFYPNKAECPTCCGCDTDLCVACSGVACGGCKNMKMWDACLPLCMAKCPGGGCASCGCDASCCSACIDVACHPMDIKKCLDVCVPVCLEKCPCLEPCSCCCDCAHPTLGFESEATIGKFVFFEGCFCCNRKGSACTYIGKRDGKDVILLINGMFVELTEDYKYAPGKVATVAPPKQKMAKKKNAKDGEKEEEEEEEEDEDGGSGFDL